MRVQVRRVIKRLTDKLVIHSKTYENDGGIKIAVVVRVYNGSVHMCDFLDNLSV